MWSWVFVLADRCINNTFYTLLRVHFTHSHVYTIITFSQIRTLSFSHSHTHSFSRKELEYTFYALHLLCILFFISFLRFSFTFCFFTHIRCRCAIRDRYFAARNISRTASLSFAWPRNAKFKYSFPSRDRAFRRRDRGSTPSTAGTVRSRTGCRSRPDPWTRPYRRPDSAPLWTRPRETKHIYSSELEQLKGEIKIQ